MDMYKKIRTVEDYDDAMSNIGRLLKKAPDSRKGLKDLTNEVRRFMLSDFVVY